VGAILQALEIEQCWDINFGFVYTTWTLVKRKKMKCVVYIETRRRCKGEVMLVELLASPLTQ
jgi:hypothetical protein